MSDTPYKHYFKQAQSCFFRWDDNGEVLVWDDGSTIAFREEVAAVMRHLAPDGLPPFNAIVVLLSACRANWPDARHYLAALSVAPKDSPLRPMLAGHSESNALALAPILAELDRIHEEMPPNVRADLRARCELAAMVFEARSKQGAWLDSDGAMTLSEQMARGLPESLESQGGLQQAIDDLPSPSDSVVIVASETQVMPEMSAFVMRDAGALLSALRSLQGGLKHVTAEALNRRLKTGLEEEVLPLPPSDADRSQSLVDSLLNDEELCGLAQLARNLLALLTFPRPLSQPQDMPLGGVSDITNRGQLDRLLLSELAHDDLTLSSRIALNEALYLHRESPPSQRSQHRRVLLDTGLCMWGIPRLFSAAVALALADVANESLAVEFFRFDEGELTPADFSSRAGVEDHLGTLTHELHPGPALKRFFDMDEVDEAEFVIVSEKSVFEAPAFNAELAESLPDAPTFLVAVDRTGDLSMSAVNHQGKRVLRSGNVKLDSILTPQKKNRQPLDSGSPDFPILLAQASFPLRVYQQPVPDRTFLTPLGVVSATGDGRLLLWDRKGWGAKQLTDQLGKGKMFWCGADPHGVPMMVWGFAAESALKLVRVHADDYVSITCLAYRGTPTRVTAHNGYVILEFHDRWEMFRSGHADCINSLKRDGSFGDLSRAVHLPAVSPASRFIRYRHSTSNVKWFALTAASGTIQLQAVPLDNPDMVKALFDRDGKGIVAIQTDGLISRLYGDAESMNAGRGFYGLMSVSADGSQFSLAHNGRAGGYLISTDYLSVERQVYGDSGPQITSGATQCVARPIRRKFAAVAVADSYLALRTQKGQVLRIQDKDGISLQSMTNLRVSGEVGFQPISSPDGCAYTLQVATWKCGSRAFLDSRGMLHLMSHNPEVPQVSLLLHEGRLAGWCEDEGAFGGGYFQLDGKQSLPSADREIYAASIREFIRCVNSN